MDRAEMLRNILDDINKDFPEFKIIAYERNKQ